jgi:hypothetical protein
MILTFIKNKNKNVNRLNLGIMQILIIISLIFSYKVLCITDLTYLNCPDKFDINSVNITTSSSSSIINFFYSAYDNPTHTARVENIVIEGNTVDLSLYIS